MKKEPLLLALLLISLVGTLTGAFLRITHRPFDDELLTVGLMGSLIFWAIALVDIFRARSLPVPERLMWVIGLLTVPFVTGWFYFFAWRRGRFAR